MKSFLQEVAEDLVEKYGENLQDYAIIFNNKRPANYLHKHLADRIQKPFWSPSIFTIQEFFALSSTLKIADFYTQFFILHRLYNAILASENAGHIDMDKFFPIAKTILSDFSQIDMDNVDPDRLFNELEDIALINQQFDFLTEEQHVFLTQFWVSYTEGKHKQQQENFIRMWRRMPQLYAGFHAELKAKGFITIGQVYKQLAQQSPAALAFTDSYKKLLFVGFNALSKTEAQIFSKWQTAGKADFYFDSDSYYLADPLHEAGLFLRKNIDQYKLINALDNQQSFLKDRQADVHVYKVQGNSTQAKVLNQVLEADYKLLMEDPTYGKTVVVLADENLLIPTLQTIPSSQEKIKVNLNVTMGIGYISSSIFGIADLWLGHQLRLHQTPTGDDLTVPYKNVEMFLTHPLIAIPERKRSEILTAFVTEQLQHIPLARLIRQRGTFDVFFQQVNSPLMLVKGLGLVMEHLMQGLLSQQQLKKLDAELFAKTIQELNRLHETLQQYHQETQEKLSYKFITALIQRALSAISVPLKGDPLSGLQIMGLLESRNLNFDHVVILGMNDGILPKSTTSHSFIPDSLRRVYGLPVLENQDAISAYIFYRLAQRAKKISLVYNSLTDESNTGEPSRFLKQLEYESVFKFHYQEQTTTIEVEQHTPVSIEKTPEIMERLQAYLNGSRSLSASALSTYLANPIDFFYKYVADIKEPKEVTEVVEANNLGTILHGALEDFYNQMRMEDPMITKARIQEKKKIIPSLIEKNLIKEFYADSSKKIRFSGMQAVIMAIVQEYIQIILDYDEQSAPFRIVQMEEEMIVPFLFKDSFGKDKQILMKGIIDRVDVTHTGKTRIVDYKTGGDVLEYHSLAEAFNTDGKKLNKALVQTLFYTYVYEKAKGTTAVEPNLYVVRQMKSKGTLFQTTRKLLDEQGKGKNQKFDLTEDFLAEEKLEFEKLLSSKLQELFDPTIPFVLSKNPENYRYTPYTSLLRK